MQTKFNLNDVSFTQSLILFNDVEKPMMLDHDGYRLDGVT